MATKTKLAKAVKDYDTTAQEIENVLYEFASFGNTTPSVEIYELCGQSTTGSGGRVGSN